MTPRNSPSLSLRAGMIVGVFAALIIVGYTIYAVLPYLLGPSLKVAETTTNGETTIVGSAARVSYLSIDGLAIPLQENGSFSTERVYPPGYTTVSVSAKDRFGRTITRMLTFVNK